MKNFIINISNDFSNYPLGRDNADGPFNGERFRKEFLVPALTSNEHVSVHLDGPKGYGSSFLEEAFGGLARLEGFPIEVLEKKLAITFTKPVYQMYHDEIWQYIREA